MNIRQEWRLPLTGAVALVAGGFVGYRIGTRKIKEIEVLLEKVETTELETIVETVVECEVCKARSDETEGMVKIVEEEGYAPPDDAVDPQVIRAGLLKAQAEEDLQRTLDLEPEEETFPDEDDLEDRSPDTPYVITKSEWDAQESGLPQMSLSWYAGDKILVDEQVVPIPKPEVVVGQLPFGKASGDSNTVYIRNEALQAEYEVIRLDSSYTIDILGMEAEEEAEAEDLKHSNQLMKFRD